MNKLFEMTLDVGKAMAETAMEARRFGVSAEQMTALNIASRGHQEGLANALRHQSQFLGEASQGGKSQNETLGTLGLTIEQLEAAPDQFGTLADAINKLPAATDRAAASAKIWGKNWTEVADMVARGSKAIDEARVSVVERGLVNPELVNVTKEYKSAVRELGEAFEGFKAKAAQGWVGVGATKAAQRFGGFVDSASQFLFGGPSREEAEEIVKRQKAREASQKAGEARVLAARRAAEQARQQAEAQAKAEAEAAAKQHEQDLSRGESLVGQMLNPLEKARGNVGELRRLAGAGIFGELGQNASTVLGRGLLQNAQSLISAAGVGGVAVSPAGFERGTAAERSMSIQIDKEREAAERPQVELLKEAVAILKQKQAADDRNAQMIVDAIRGGELNLVDFPGY
jgi:hypothetical protein